MRTRYDKQLQELCERIKQMGGECTECLSFATQALLLGNSDAPLFADKSRSCAMLAENSALNVHTMCEDIIMRQQPVAHDLRIVIAAQRMATDMARIAGQGAGIAEMARKADMAAGDECRAIAKMADCVIKMLYQSIDAFANQDIKTATSVREADDEVDALFRDARAELVGMMTGGGESRERAERALDYMLIAKYLERAGDHAVAVANAVMSML